MLWDPCIPRLRAQKRGDLLPRGVLHLVAGDCCFILMEVCLTLLIALALKAPTLFNCSWWGKDGERGWSPCYVEFAFLTSRLHCELAAGLIFISFCTRLVVQKAQQTNLQRNLGSCCDKVLRLKLSWLLFPFLLCLKQTPKPTNNQTSVSAAYQHLTLCWIHAYCQLVL